MHPFTLHLVVSLLAGCMIGTVINGAIQSGFEYGGQKCSALSRMYVPESLWPEVMDC